MKKCYNITVYCGNCHNNVKVDIAQGTEVTVALEEKLCPICGCSMETRKATAKYGIQSMDWDD